MFKPSSNVGISGEVNGIRIVVAIEVSAESADATNRVNTKTATIVEVHNTATAVLVAVNEVMRQIQEDALGLRQPQPAAIPPPPVAGQPDNVLAFRQRLEQQREEEPPV